MSLLARQPARFRQWFALCLLVLCAALPLHAWAVDTDGDGVDDSVDAFPNNAEATTDTDHDGKPDSINASKLQPLGGFSSVSPWQQYCSPSALYPTGICWSGSSGAVSGYFKAGLVSQTSGSVSVTVFVPSGTGSFSFSATKPASGIGTYTRWYIDYVLNGSCNTGLSCTSPVYNLPAGKHSLEWSACNSCVGGTCQGVTSHTLNNLASSNVYIASSLTEDTDDDNDGVADVTDKFPLNSAEWLDTDNDGIGNNADMDDDNDGIPDYIDADPLNAAVNTEKILPVNGSYKGSGIRESQAVQ